MKNTLLELNNGVPIPRLGLGCYQLPAGAATLHAVDYALEVGYRHIDTARMYGNEEAVGEAVRNSFVPREEIFVTTKLWNDDHGYDRAIAACRESLATLGLEHIDLYLIHWPVEGKRRDSWRALETLTEDGLCRSIGVSNYTIPHLEELLGECRIMPSVNQVEFSPFLYQTELLKMCRREQIALEAYSPLTKARRLGDERLTAIAAECGRSPAQVLITWALQHDLIVIPKASRPEHILENFESGDVELTADQMHRLDALDEGLRTSWDPTSQN